MSKLSLLDLGFLIAESEASPKHVAGLLIFKRPAGARAGFARKVYESLLAATDVQPPFNRVLAFSLAALPHWAECDGIDMAQHVFFHKLEKGANTRADLYRLVADLHTPVLDRSRPMWEAHVIDGLEGGRFALYQRLHHAYADGVTMSRWIAQALSDTPDDKELRPVWTLPHNGGAEGRRLRLQRDMLQSAVGNLKGTAARLLGVSRLSAMLLLEGVKLTKNAIALPFAASRHTPLTGQVTPGRQFTAVAVPMERIARIQAVTRSTLNHVALTCLDGALRRYLEEQGVQLAQPIVIQMPVNLRKDGEKTTGNKIGIIQVELSPPTDDPYVRLRNIGFSLRNVRTMVDSVAPAAIETYTIVTGLLGQLAEMARLSDHMPPTGNTLVSNVPGPPETLYMQGAPLEEMHPISTLPPSNLLNITLFSYAGTLNFGLIATDALPGLERIGEYVLAAFEELEQAVRAA
ncbi:wax ester/triacylglycerol synthase family O-acyltransferase [Pseudoduganella namucuonensis]|uniref:diacylglycerol O-acyltransferase n=1 Tax=Pseudoduganella namucuonensis TaxID=1035707 RepID=A0A1I7JVD5_9BURK|nr:wax ester/triacylglycerol synthase family O-acyltransferase [Pseudoduganella namucuonensis]SFU89141.1 Diacylglycerol O-acyltransferase [Pseudoduganella namucuonensis]